MKTNGSAEKKGGQPSASMAASPQGEVSQAEFFLDARQSSLPTVSRAGESQSLAPPAEQPFPPHIGRYRILRVIGEGGMGVVYQAERERPRQVVALKVIRPGMAPRQGLRRFEREQEILARLQHAYIARIYDADVVDSGAGPQPYFAMELVDGLPFTTYAETNNLSIRQRIELVAKVAEGIHHAHTRGVIHRDLKPANILVDSAGQPKIVDFGVARVTDADLQTATLRTSAGDIVGTLPYMSPEQAGGEPDDIDTRSDVYSLGVVAYELLSGRLPYSIPSSLPEALRVIREEDPAPLSTKAGGLRSGELQGDIETIVAKALEKDKERRYESAAAMAADILRYLRDEPIAARPPSTWYQFSKFARRNQRFVGALAGTFLVLVTGVIVSTLLFLRSEHQRQIAEAQRARATAADSDNTLANIDLALQRGTWGVAIGQIARALELGYGDSVELRLKKVLAHDGLSQYRDALNETESLSSQTLSAPQQANVRLWKGELLLMDPERRSEALKLLREALLGELREADGKYVEGLLALTVPEAADAFKAAVEADPFHVRARAMHGVALLVMGEREDAIASFEVAGALFPNDPALKLALALARATRGQPMTSGAILKQLGQFETEEERTAVAGIVDLINYVMHVLQTAPVDGVPTAELTAIIARASMLIPLISRIDQSGDVGHLISTARRRYFVALAESWGRILSSTDMTRILSANPFDHAKLDDLRAAARANPEGVTLSLLALSLAGVPGSEAELLAVARQALEKPAMLDVRPWMQTLIISRYIEQISDGRIQVTPELKRELRELTLELYQGKRMGSMLLGLVGVPAVLADDPELSLWLIEDALRNGAEPAGFLTARDRVRARVREKWAADSSATP